MNDQSKPKNWKAVCFDPLCEIHNQPKPIKGEWTAESVREIGGHFSITQQRNQTIANGHNAALAAEKKWESLYRAALVVADEQAKQLAAERERAGQKCPTCGYQLVTLDNDELKALTEKAAYHELRKQLDAERERSEEQHEEVIKLEKQLATLVDALERIEELYDGEGVQAESIARDALAKIGGEK